MTTKQPECERARFHRPGTYCKTCKKLMPATAKPPTEPKRGRR